MTEVAPGTEGSGAQPPPVRTWPDYVIALLGSIVGGYLTGWQLVRALESQPGNLSLALFGPILLIPLGSAVGTTVALALSGRHSPVLTGILTVPVTLAVGIAVVVVSSLLGTVAYGLLIITPPLVAPLGARFIVLGKKPPPSKPQPWIRVRNWPIRRIVRYGIPVLIALLGAWSVVNWLDSGDPDVVAPAPSGPRICGCELLTEWVEALAISPRNDSFRASNLRVAELPEGFVVTASQYVGDRVDVDHYRIVFGDAGFTGVQLFDQPDHWSATFFEGETRNQSPWILDVALLDSHVKMTIRVRVDGSEWEITGTDQLWQFYTSHREEALEVQRERQVRAVDILEPVERALGRIQGT